MGLGVLLGKIKIKCSESGRESAITNDHQIAGEHVIAQTYRNIYSASYHVYTINGLRFYFLTWLPNVYIVPRRMKAQHAKRSTFNWPFGGGICRTSPKLGEPLNYH